VFIINTIDVEVRDVPDPATIAAIRGTAHGTFSHLVGAWHVRVAAADEPGYWDLRVRGGFGRHIARFLASPDRVAEGVERRLRSFLRANVPSLSARN
jgi:hypothetical protein